MNFAVGKGPSIKLRPKSATQSFKDQDKSFRNVKETRVGRFRAEFTLTPVQTSLLHSLTSFWTDERVDQLLRPITNQKGTTSLRILDWLCTNWSKKHNVVVRGEGGREASIHQAYRRNLSIYKRRNFDPFRRRTRLWVEHPNGDVESTVGQLNYLHFCHESGVYRFCNEHVAEIESDMNQVLSQSKKRKREAKERGEVVRRVELTKGVAGATKAIIQNRRTFVNPATGMAGGGGGTSSSSSPPPPPPQAQPDSA